MPRDIQCPWCDSSNRCTYACNFNTETKQLLDISEEFDKYQGAKELRMIEEINRLRKEIAQIERDYNP